MTNTTQHPPEQVEEPRKIMSDIDFADWLDGMCDHPVFSKLNPEALDNYCAGVLMDCAARIRQRHVIPDGMVVVPKEPTEAMMAARSIPGILEGTDTRIVYQAMLAAAPAVALKTEQQVRDEVLAWQPIETAPRDGTPIIAFGHELDEPSVVAWFGTRWLARWDMATVYDINDEGKYIDNPTHWMPLPPTSKGSGE